MVDEPTGLSTAYRLHELGYKSSALYEMSDDVGGCTRLRMWMRRDLCRDEGRST